MKSDIHPDVRTRSSSATSRRGATFLTRSTVGSAKTIEWEDGNTYPVIDVEISSESHPFYTGKQRIMDCAGRVEKFNSALQGLRRVSPTSFSSRDPQSSDCGSLSLVAVSEPVGVGCRSVGVRDEHYLRSSVRDVREPRGTAKPSTETGSISSRRATATRRPAAARSGPMVGHAVMRRRAPAKARCDPVPGVRRRRERARPHSTRRVHDRRAAADRCLSDPPAVERCSSVRALAVATAALDRGSAALERRAAPADRRAISAVGRDQRGRTDAACAQRTGHPVDATNVASRVRRMYSWKLAACSAHQPSWSRCSSRHRRPSSSRVARARSPARPARPRPRRRPRRARHRGRRRSAAPPPRACACPCGTGPPPCRSPAGR